MTTTPASIGQEARREIAGGFQLHSRQSVLLRLLTHDAYHGGEIAQVLDVHGRAALDLWPPQPVQTP